MSMSNAAEAALLDLLFLNEDWTGVGDAGGLQNSAAAGSLYIALHDADPGEAGSQTTNEIAYTGYARVAVVRTAGGWERAGSTVENVALVQFGQCTAGSATATYFSVGRDASGAGQIILSGPLSASLAISNGIQPQFPAGALTATLD